MICNNNYLADILRICEIKDLIRVMRFQRPLVYFRDKGYLPFYFQGYRILSILLPGIWDIMCNIFATFRDIEYLGQLIMGIFPAIQASALSRKMSPYWHQLLLSSSLFEQ